MNVIRHPRQDIYYWKCDRPAAFHGLHGRAADGVNDAALTQALIGALRRHFGDSEITLRPGAGQGNHGTFLARIAGRDAFVRVEDGPDGDDYLEVEAHLLRELAALRVPVPTVLGVDATRIEVPFAWQVLERIPQPDLNTHLKAGRLDPVRIAPRIGNWIAHWQVLTPAAFGPFDIAALRQTHQLVGYHSVYRDYYHTRLDEHLAFLVGRDFLPHDVAGEIRREVERHSDVLALRDRGCLVHKDLALWNILGSPDGIAAFIDWNDSIAGDPMDDVSLLACFHDGAMIARVLEGYAEVRPFPAEWRRRFWLHLLRNMIWKAVIRVGAGYFDQNSAFFLIGTGHTGGSLREFTSLRIAAALKGLRAGSDPDLL